MAYEYKGTLPLEEQREAISKLIEKLAEKIDTSVVEIEFHETDDYVVIGVDDNVESIILEGSNVPHFGEAVVYFANPEDIDWCGTEAGQLYANLEDRLNEEYGLILLDAYEL